MKLRLAKELALPLDVVTQKLAWLGVTGSGKTYGASKLAELLWHAGAQVLVIDPVGVWYGLRLATDGKKPSELTVPIFGGLHGDVPLEPTAGPLIANLVVDKTLSAILDVSQFESDADKARFARDFADRFFFRKKASPSAVHVFLEECQEFVPQNPQKGEERMLHAFVRLQKLGRNFGIGSSYISQRPQEVNKKALNMAQTLFVFRTTGTHERGAIEKWIEDKALDEDIAGDLPKIPTGQCHVWSPEFLKISETVHILEKETFNASATPEVGAKATTRELAPIDLARVASEMAATIEKAKAEDPRELRKTIADLKKQVAAKVPTSTPPPKPTRVEVPVLKDAQLTRLEKIYDRMLAEADKHGKAMAMLWEQQSDEAKALLDVLRVVANIPKVSAQVHQMAQRSAVAERGPDHQAPAASAGSRGTAAGRVVPRSRPPLGDRAQAREPEGGDRQSPHISSNGRVKGAEQRILNALAELEALGVAEVRRVQVAFFAGYTHLNSKGLVNALGALRTNGYIDYPTKGRVVLTAAGRAHAESSDAPRTAEELRDRVVQMLGGASARVLAPLIAAYPRPMKREDLAADARYGHLNSKGFVNALGRLRSLGFIDYPHVGMVAAQPVLFLE